jgi:hypothetical protein
MPSSTGLTDNNNNNTDNSNNNKTTTTIIRTIKAIDNGRNPNGAPFAV